MPLAPRQTITAQRVSMPLNLGSEAGQPQANSLMDMSLVPANSQAVPRSPLEEGGCFGPKPCQGLLECCRGVGNSSSSQKRSLAQFHLLI